MRVSFWMQTSHAWGVWNLRPPWLLRSACRDGKTSGLGAPAGEEPDAPLWWCAARASAESLTATTFSPDRKAGIRPTPRVPQRWFDPGITQALQLSPAVCHHRGALCGPCLDWGITVGFKIHKHWNSTESIITPGFLTAWKKVMVGHF